MHQNNHFTSGLAQIIKWEQALEEDKNIDEEVAGASFPIRVSCRPSLAKRQDSEDQIPQPRGFDSSYFISIDF